MALRLVQLAYVLELLVFFFNDDLDAVVPERVLSAVAPANIPEVQADALVAEDGVFNDDGLRVHAK